MNRSTLTCAGVALVAMIAACTTEAGYSAAQQWQRNECRKLIDADDQRRCQASNQPSFEAYRRQTEAGIPAR